jgi:PAS domain S-box-containing protein
LRININIIHHHNKFRYLTDYLKTGKAKIIGTSRRVVAKHKSGFQFPIDLAVTETRTATRHTCTGMVTTVADNNNNNNGNAPMNNEISERSTFLTLEGLVEPALSIDTKGTILYANSAAKEFFGFHENDLVGHNVAMLMPSPYKENHDHYLHNYATTNKSTVIGKNRPLICELSDGSIVPINLSVSEVTLPSGKKIFTGIIRKREVHNRKEKTLLQQEREVVNGLYVASIIVDEKGLVQAFNKSAQKIFGYDLSEILGQNVKVITGPHKDKHDQYIRNYLETGVAKVIGKERELVTTNKFNQNIKIKLSVVEKKDEDGKRFFTGMLHQV